MNIWYWIPILNFFGTGKIPIFTFKVTTNMQKKKKKKKKKNEIICKNKLTPLGMSIWY
ncbi:hypothetical protein HanRHA438_Chr01g0017531 [Helianthus annuus]|nr:hypothetical protein HanRHA438_Chr01g0017531 [Helianthus annuus]